MIRPALHRGRDWYLGRTRREQVLLAAAAAIAAVLIVVFLIAIPLINGVGDARDGYDEAVIRHGRIEAKVDALDGGADSRGRPPTGPLVDFVRQSAEAAGFTLDAADPAGEGQVAIRIASATPEALFGWLGGLEARGLSVENLTVDPAPNNAGTLSIAATLRRPA
ncbi:type II secretion system protein GspM [Novosphingopyxis sp.]|uniref:type II secretion system protein GspM n=1 Tax=Novosphingopyxis sp. TaxID=2709690 RepID=UPI003B5BA1C1